MARYERLTAIGPVALTTLIRAFPDSIAIPGAGNRHDRSPGAYSTYFVFPETRLARNASFVSATPLEWM